MDIVVDKSASYDSLKDRVAIVTGGGQGIGRGFAHHFAAQGAIPVVADISGENAARVQAEVETGGGRALGIETDVASEAAAGAMAEAALSAFGRIDILINNAAVFSRITMAPFWEVPVDEWKSAMDVNITGACFRLLALTWRRGPERPLALDPTSPRRTAAECSRASISARRGFTAPLRNPRRATPYLTIEHKGPVPHEFRRPMGNRIYGCDDCLAVCPWNKFAARAREPDLLPRVELTAPKLADLAGLDETGFREVFAGSPIKRTGRNRFLRNVLIAVGNSGDAKLVPTARHALDDPAPLVRGAAVWALRELLPGPGFDALRTARLPAEADASVRREWTYEEASPSSRR